MQVLVRDNNVEQALRVLKKKIAARRRIQRNEAGGLLRKTFRKSGSRKVRSHSPRSQAGSEAGHPRRIDRCPHQKAK